MALGNNNNNNATLFILKVVEKDEEKKKVSPFFSVSRKVDGKYQKESQVTRVSGNLYRIDVRNEEYQGTPYITVNLFLRDGEESYLLDLRMNIATRGLFNSIFSLENYEGLSFTVYQNNRGYTSLGLWQGETMVKWKHKIDELPQPKEVTFKGKKMHDYTEVDEFFAKELRVISDKFGGSKASKTKTSNTSTPTPLAGAPKDEVEDPTPF